ncbi:MAG: Calx-beta domain-containing protein [Verrucomicrobiota bacterium]
MKTDSLALSAPKRILGGLLASFCIALAPAASAATPIGQVPVPLFGEVLGNNKEIHVSSGAKRIEASKLYQYQILGKVRGKKGTPAENLLPQATAIPAFLDSISPGSSRFLKGSFSNPTGQLPITVLDRQVSGSRNVPGLGRVNLTIKLLGTIDANGVCRLDITGVKFKSARANNLGSIEFMKGSKLLISAAPVVTFLRVATTLSEDAGSVTVTVRRMTNLHGTVTVNYATVPDTATTSDYTHTSGTLSFGPSETSKNITIPLIDNAANDGVRRFTVALSNPSTGSFLGTMPTTKIVLLDDE